MAVIYFDTNVFAHVHDAAEEEAFVDWLLSGEDRALLSYHHLWEALAITDAALRRSRVRLLRSLPCEYVPYPPYLESMELLGEIRRSRPGWLRRFPDTSQVDINLNFLRRLWHIAENEDDVVEAATRAIRDMTQARRDGAIAAMKMLRSHKREGGGDVTELVLGSTVIALGDATKFDDPVAWWRRHALDNWHAALILRDPGISDWNDYLGGYLDRAKMPTEDFTRFWLDDARPEAMPRGFVHAAAMLAQLDHRIDRSNILDADHVAASLDADHFVTEDGALHAVCEAVRKLEPRLPSPHLARRMTPSAVAAIDAAMRPVPT